MTGLLQTAFYFGYTALACSALGITTGTIGAFSASAFVTAIFTSLKLVRRVPIGMVGRRAHPCGRGGARGARVGGCVGGEGGSTEASFVRVASEPTQTHSAPVIASIVPIIPTPHTFSPATQD